MVEKDGNDLLNHPHVFLDQIMRQAQESEIIRLSMKIRNGEYLDNFDGREVKIYPSSKLSTGILLWGDIVLAATNNARIQRNNQIRQTLDRPETPVEQDKVICLRNYWDLATEQENALVNGSIGYLKNVKEDIIKIPYRINTTVREIEVYKADILFEDGDVYYGAVLDKKLLLTGEKCCDWKDSYKLQQARKRYGRLEPQEFAFSNVITCHKAQGSEWDKVVVLEEKFPFSRDEHKRWLYTAVTRASERLILLKS